MILNGRTAFVTGGTHGIGRAIVARFLEEGARVATVAREAADDLLDGVLFAPYDLADHAGITGMVAAVEREIGPHGILVNAVAPGFISTRLSVSGGVHERDTDWFQGVYITHGKLPLRRHAEPSEVAPSVVWLASEQNGYITGQVLGVDGGLSITF